MSGVILISGLKKNFGFNRMVKLKNLLSSDSL